MLRSEIGAGTIIKEFIDSDNMEYLDGTLCISYSELTHGDPRDRDIVKRPIFTESNFKYYKKKEKIRILQRACYGTPALVAYNSLPDKIKEKVVAKYGDPESNAKKYVLANMYIKDLVAENFYKTFKVDAEHTHLREDLVTLYTNNASMLNAVMNLVSNRTLCIKSYGKQAGRVWGEVSRDLNAIQETFGCKLPKNHLSLKRLVEKYKADSYVALISGKHGNNNARANKLPEQDALIGQLIGDGRNLDNEMVARLYNTVAEKMGWKSISGSTIANYKNEHPECFPGRHGKNAFANQKLMQVKRSAPSCPMFFWCVDGWDTELYYRSKAISKTTGGEVTVYHKRPTTVAIVDPFNKYIIGYAIGTNETPALIRQAFRNAFEHVKELFGAYFKPWQLQTDNYGRGNLKPFYEACTHYYTPAAVGNAKSKIIEPFFMQINRKYFRIFPNSSGYGVKSKARLQVSDDWIEQHKRQFPEYTRCCEQIEQVIELDRRTKIEAYKAKWLAMPTEKHLEFGVEDFLYAFGETVEPRKLLGDGIRLQIDNDKFYYDCDDQAFRDYGHCTFFLKYNPENMDRVLAIQNVGTAKEPKEGPVRFMLERKYVQPMAIMDRKPGDMDELMKVWDFNRRRTEIFIQKRKESAEIVREFFDENEDRLGVTLAAHVITDSLGRHKDVRNEVAGRTGRKELPSAPIEEILEEDEGYEIMINENDYLKDF